LNSKLWGCATASARLSTRYAIGGKCGAAITSAQLYLFASRCGDIHRDLLSSLVSGFAAEIDLAGVARMRAQKQKAMVDPITSAIITVFHKTMVCTQLPIS
jgi:hypothetical protein